MLLYKSSAYLPIKSANTSALNNALGKESDRAASEMIIPPPILPVSLSALSSVCVSGYIQHWFSCLPSFFSDFASCLCSLASHSTAEMEFVLWVSLCSPDAQSHSTAVCRASRRQLGPASRVPRRTNRRQYFLGCRLTYVYPTPISTDGTVKKK